MANNVQIDGSYGEGGGQVLRTSLSLSALTGKPVEITNIRAGRSKPGLQPQHLASVRAAAALCHAATDGAIVGSQRLVFTPFEKVIPGPYKFEIGTAGATPLVMQTVLLPLALAGGPSSVEVTGGTHVPHAPPFEYLEHVYGSMLKNVGLMVDFYSESAGFYPRGGGSIQAEIAPIAALRPVDLTNRDTLDTVTVHIVTSELAPEVAERAAKTAHKWLPGRPKPRIAVHEVAARGPGAAVIIVAEWGGIVAGFSSIGERGKRMEIVTEEACAAFHEWRKSGVACEEHLADQLVLPMALVPETSKWTTSRVTEHLRTGLWVVRQFLPIEVTLDERADGTGLVTMRGVSIPDI